MPIAHELIITELEKLDFSGKGENFVESRYLTPLLECLGYESHKDYEVIRHGDHGSTFKLRYPSVERGTSKVRHHNPDYIPTFENRRFGSWQVAARSKSSYPRASEFLTTTKFLSVSWLQHAKDSLKAKALIVQHPRTRTARKAANVLSHLEYEVQTPLNLFSPFSRFASNDRILVICANGVLEISPTGRHLAPHDPELYFDGRIEAAYDPDVVPETFERVLQEALPDPGDIELFRIFLGTFFSRFSV